MKKCVNHFCKNTKHPPKTTTCPEQADLKAFFRIIALNFQDHVHFSPVIACFMLCVFTVSHSCFLISHAGYLASSRSLISRADPCFARQDHSVVRTKTPEPACTFAFTQWHSVWQNEKITLKHHHGLLLLRPPF